MLGPITPLESIYSTKNQFHLKYTGKQRDRTILLPAVRNLTSELRETEMLSVKEKLSKIQINVNSSWAERKRSGLKCTEMQDLY